MSNNPSATCIPHGWKIIAQRDRLSRREWGSRRAGCCVPHRSTVSTSISTLRCSASWRMNKYASSPYASSYMFDHIQLFGSWQSIDTARLQPAGEMTWRRLRLHQAVPERTQATAANRLRCRGVLQAAAAGGKRRCFTPAAAGLCQCTSSHSRWGKHTGIGRPSRPMGFAR